TGGAHRDRPPAPPRRGADQAGRTALSRAAPAGRRRARAARRGALSDPPARKRREHALRRAAPRDLRRAARVPAGLRRARRHEPGRTVAPVRRRGPRAALRAGGRRGPSRAAAAAAGATPVPLASRARDGLRNRFEMPVLPTRVDPRSEAYRVNHAAMLEQVQLLDEQLALARAGGGPKYVRRHRGGKKLRPRERLA